MSTDKGREDVSFYRNSGDEGTIRCQYADFNSAEARLQEGRVRSLVSRMPLNVLEAIGRNMIIRPPGSTGQPAETLEQDI